MTRGEAIDQLSERVGNNTVFWKAAEKGYAVNEGICVWQALTGNWQAKFSFPLIAGESLYPVPRQIVLVQRVRLGGVALTPTSAAELDSLSPGWENAPASTPTHWIHVGLAEIQLYPAPSASLSVTLEGLASAPRVEFSPDTIDLSDDELSLLLNYGLFYLAFKEGTSELEAVKDNLKAFLEASRARLAETAAVAIFRSVLGWPRDENIHPYRAGEKTGPR